LGTADDTNGDMTVDFGFTPYVSRGSTLFYDNNNSGTHDAGETGIDNVVVELLDVNGTVVMTTTTDINGDYLFDATISSMSWSLATIRFVSPQPQPMHPPAAQPPVRLMTM